MNTAYEHVTLSTDENQIAWLTLDVKNEPANILNPDVIEECLSACDKINSLNARGLIIHSGKPGGFIAGADVKKFQGISDSEDDKKRALQFIHSGQELCQRIENLAFPTLAMIKGFCMGGGLEIALACDYIITDDAPSTKLSLPEIRLGIHPGFGGSVRSIRRIGVLQAMSLMLSGRNLLPRAAAKVGLIDYCVPLRQLINTSVHTILDTPPPKKPAGYLQLLEYQPFRKLVAWQLRKQVASRAREKHYPAPYALIRLWETHGSHDKHMYQAEAESVAGLVASKTAQNLVRVFFLQNRLKDLGDKFLFSPRQVHVIGGGVMGGDIAAWCAIQGMQVTIQDVNSKALGNVVARANKGFVKRYRKDRLRIMQAQDNLIPDPHGQGISKADVVIEAIFENLEAKQQLFMEVEKKAKPGALLASNTSSIPLHKISETMQQPERLIGLHFFNPVFKMPLLEIVHNSQQTDTDVINLALSFAVQINKLPIPVKSSPGFLINRILMPYMLEGVIIHQEGVPAGVVDAAARDYGMPMGPLELADTVGLDICLHVAKILADTVDVKLPDTLDEQVRQGHLGKKSGQGFYLWNKGKKKSPRKSGWNGDKNQLQARLIEKLLTESKKCLDECIVEDADLLDAGVIFGTGFAPFRGGPMHVLLEAKADIKPEGTSINSG